MHGVVFWGTFQPGTPRGEGRIDARHQLPVLRTAHPSCCCTAAALPPPGCPHAAPLLLERFSRQAAASSADAGETRAGRCGQPLPNPCPNPHTKLRDSRLVQILETLRWSKGWKRVWRGKPAPTETLEELRANKHGAGEGFPAGTVPQPAGPASRARGGISHRMGHIPPRGPVSPPRSEAGACGRRSPAFCCSKGSHPAQRCHG